MLAVLLTVQAIAILKVIRDEAGIFEAKPMVGRSVPVVQTPSMEPLYKRDNSTLKASNSTKRDTNSTKRATIDDGYLKFTNETKARFVDLEKALEQAKARLASEL